MNQQYRQDNLSGREKFRGSDSSGFTITELIVTLAVVAILAGIAAPSFRSMILDKRLRTQADEYFTMLMVARSEAVKRGIQVTVCKSGNTSSSPPSCAGAGVDWEDGVIIFVDNDGDQVLDAGEQILQLRGTLEGGNTMRGEDTTNNGVNTDIAFLASGLAKDEKGTSKKKWGKFFFCDTRGAAEGRMVEVSATGRSSITVPATSCL